MNSDNAIIAWLQDAYKRLGKKSPKFFKVINYVTGAAALITGLPSVVDTITTKFHITLPPQITDLENATVFAAASLGWFISKLTAADDSKLKFVDPPKTDDTSDTSSGEDIKKPVMEITGS